MKTRAPHYLAGAAIALLLAGCAATSIDDTVAKANRDTQGFTAGKLELSRTEQQRRAREQLAQDLLSKPLAMDDAVQLALANSPAVQALLAQTWADIAAANQSGRIANPLFTFERARLNTELEFDRLLSFGLLDLLTLPQRQATARNQALRARVQLSAAAVEMVSRVRQTWIRAVAARQNFEYAQQVKQAAEASAELAKRMQQVGNFTKLQRARQQVFYADAAAQLASAQQAVTSTREELVRLLGLDDKQTVQLQLPDRLPDLPAQPRAATEVSAAATEERLDVQLARLRLDAAGKAQGLRLLSSLFDTDIGARHDTVFDNGTGQRTSRNGYEIDIRLPLFDWGGAQRASMNAQSLAAANQYEAVIRAASSYLRESYSAYRTAYDLARHYRDEIVPLRKTMAEENVLRYNGMLIGVFELLAETREQIASVMAAINAQQQFWLADAGLSASVIGSPVATGPTSTSSGADAPTH